MIIIFINIVITVSIIFYSYDKQSLLKPAAVLSVLRPAHTFSQILREFLESAYLSLLEFRGSSNSYLMHICSSDSFPDCFILTTPGPNAVYSKESIRRCRYSHEPSWNNGTKGEGRGIKGRGWEKGRQLKGKRRGREKRKGGEDKTSPEKSLLHWPVQLNEK